MTDYISYVLTDDFYTVHNLKTGEVLIVTRHEVGDEAFEESRDIIQDEQGYPPDERFQAAYNALYAKRDMLEEVGFNTGLGDEQPEYISWEGVEIPASVLEVVSAKVGMDKHRWKRFFQRLTSNPSNKVFTQLAAFIHSCPGISIDNDGYVRAFKGVRDDYYDVHSHTNLNLPGTSHEMPRNKVEDDPNKPCGQGLHLGSLSYATSWGDRVVVCKVDPADVVSVPKDHSHQKLRCCKYEVLHEVSKGRGHLTDPA